MIFGILPSLYVVQLWCKGAGNLRRWVKWVADSYLELLIPYILVLEKYIGCPLRPKTSQIEFYYKCGAVPEMEISLVNRGPPRVNDA